METVLDALKAMEKASYRDVAARLNIDPVVALTMLREQKEQGLCDFAGGGWFLGTAAEQKPKRVRPKVTSPLVDEILAAMEGQGAMSTLQIAGKTGRNAKALNASLGAMNKNGQVKRHVDRKNITWSLPDEAESKKSLKPAVSNSDDNHVGMGANEQDKPVAGETTQQNSIQKPTHGKEKSISEIVNDIPAFTARADDLVIPSSRFISSEIRRTKAKLASLQKLQGAVRELRRHKNLLESMSND